MRRSAPTPLTAARVYTRVLCTPPAVASRAEWYERGCGGLVPKLEQNSCVILRGGRETQAMLENVYHWVPGCRHVPLPFCLTLNLRKIPLLGTSVSSSKNPAPGYWAADNWKKCSGDIGAL